MIIYVGSDHRGYELKNGLVSFLKNEGYQVDDLGAHSYDENDDYPDFAARVALNVSLEYESSRGIIICGSGAGVDIVSNKFERIRCVLGFNSNQVYDSRNDDDTNMLALPADYMNLETAKNLAVTWLETPFSGESRHKRRLTRIFEIEEKTTKNIKKEDFGL